MTDRGGNETRSRRTFVLYEAPGGGKTVEKEISKAALTLDEAAVMQVVLDRVECGDNLPGDIKHVRGSIWEVRISGNRRTFRLLYAYLSSGDPCLLGLYFFGKKTPKTPPEAIKLAEQRLSTVTEQM